MGRKAISGAAGKHGRLFLDGNEFCAEDWDIREIGEEEDTTSTCSAGQAEQEFGVTQLEGTINYTWDVTNNPFDNPPNLKVGEKLTALLYVHALPGVGLQDGPFYSFTLHVTQHSLSVPVKGKVAGTVEFKSHGSYTLPTGDSNSSGV